MTEIQAPSAWVYKKEFCNNRSDHARVRIVREVSNGRVFAAASADEEDPSPPDGPAWSWDRAMWLKMYEPAGSDDPRIPVGSTWRYRDRPLSSEVRIVFAVRVGMVYYSSSYQEHQEWSVYNFLAEYEMIAIAPEVTPSDDSSEDLPESPTQEQWVAATEDQRQRYLATYGGFKADAGKAAMHLVPYDAIEGLAHVLALGAKKYTDRNWERGMLWSRPFAAMMRHMMAWWMGEDTDPETGLNHLDHALCCVTFLSAYEKRGMTEHDDRPGASQ